MAIKRQRTSRASLIKFALFLLFVLVSGYGLSVTGNTENPFESMGSIIEMRQMLTETSTLTFATPPGGDGTVAASDELVFPTDPLGGVPSDEDSAAENDLQITWSAFGEVLYDLWFLCATTAFVIIVGRPIGWVVKRFQPSRKQTMPVSRTGHGSPMQAKE